jgi:hypothetical protein
LIIWENSPSLGKNHFLSFFGKEKVVGKKISKSSLLFLSSFSYGDLVNIVELIFV